MTDTPQYETDAPATDAPATDAPATDAPATNATPEGEPEFDITNPAHTAFTNPVDVPNRPKSEIDGAVDPQGDIPKSQVLSGMQSSDAPGPESALENAGDVEGGEHANDPDQTAATPPSKQGVSAVQPAPISGAQQGVVEK